jgi:hypothetical protein
MGTRISSSPRHMRSSTKGKTIVEETGNEAWHEMMTAFEAELHEAAQDNDRIMVVGDRMVRIATGMLFAVLAGFQLHVIILALTTGITQDLAIITASIVVTGAALAEATEKAGVSLRHWR